MKSEQQLWESGAIIPVSILVSVLRPRVSTLPKVTWLVGGKAGSVPRGLPWPPSFLSRDSVVT